MLFRRKAKEAGANFRSDEILPMRIFALAKFRQSEISLLWNANFCQDDRGIWNSRALELNLVLSFHRMLAKIKEIREFRFIFARHHYKEGSGGVDGRLWYVVVFRNDFAFSGKPLIFATRWGIFYGWWPFRRPATSLIIVAILAASLNFSKNKKSG